MESCSEASGLLRGLDTGPQGRFLSWLLLWLLRAQGPAVLTSHPLHGTQAPARSWPRTLAIGVFPMLPPQDTLLLKEKSSHLH